MAAEESRQRKTSHSDSHNKGKLRTAIATAKETFAQSRTEKQTFNSDAALPQGGQPKVSVYEQTATTIQVVTSREGHSITCPPAPPPPYTRLTALLRTSAAGADILRSS